MEKVKVTNNLSINIEIHDVFNQSRSEEVDYVFTKLGEVKSGETIEIKTIHLANMLYATYTGIINDQYFYQFPVASKEICPILNRYGPFVITSSDKNGMEETFQFSQYRERNPNSKEALDFDAISRSIHNYDAKINKFFDENKEFPNCSAHKWAAMNIWLNNYTSPWQGCYFIYTKSGEIQLISVVKITSDSTQETAQLLVNVVGENPSTAASFVKVKMTGGLLKVANNTDESLISLKPIWSKQEKDNEGHIVGAELSGTYAGQEVIGTQIMKPLKNVGSEELTPAHRVATQQSAQSMHASGLSPVQIAYVLKNAFHCGAYDVLYISNSIFEVTKKIAEKIMKAVTFSIEETTAALKDVLNYTNEAITEVLKGVGYSVNAIVGTLHNVLKMGVSEIHDVMADVGYSANEIKNVFEQEGGEFGHFVNKTWNKVKKIFDPTNWP